MIDPSPTARESESPPYRHGYGPPHSAIPSLDFVCPVRTPSWLRLLILLWLVIWMTSVPLFHVHIPDITDRWSALQTGGAHTVFSPDLPGEFSRPFHNSDQEHAAQLSSRGTNSPELGIALLNGETKRATQLDILGTLYHIHDRPRLFGLLSAFLEKDTQVYRSQTLTTPRAPPRIIIS